LSYDRETLSTEDQIVAAIRRIMRAVDLHSKKLVDRIGLTGPQLAALQEAERLGPTSPSDIARSAHLSQATVTGILQRLERRGLLVREPSQRDRRGVVVTVTEAGRAVLNQTPSLLQERFRSELASLQEWERNAILSTLQRVAGLMDAERLDASPHLISDTVSLAHGGDPTSSSAQWPEVGEPEAGRSGAADGVAEE